MDIKKYTELFKNNKFIKSSRLDYYFVIEFKGIIEINDTIQVRGKFLNLSPISLTEYYFIQVDAFSIFDLFEGCEITELTPATNEEFLKVLESTGLNKLIDEFK